MNVLDSRPFHIAVALALLVVLASLTGCATPPDDGRTVVSRSSCTATRYGTSCRARSGAYESTTTCWHGGWLTTCNGQTTRRTAR
jgi:hypothetical protein